MADIRVTHGLRPTSIGEPVGVQVNTFGLQRLEGITGEDLAPILLRALEPVKEGVQRDWPRDTGASGDTIRTEVDEIGPVRARASLRVGGDELRRDPRNRKGIDYAPFIEFNGSPGGTPPGTILYNFSVNRAEMRRAIHEGVRQLLLSRLGGG